MKLINKISVLSILFIGLTIQAKAQCPVNAYASKATIVCGDPVTLTAVADGCKPLNNDFNNGTIGPDWQATNGAVVNNGTGTYSCVGPAPEGSSSLWMGADVAAPRQIETNSYDLTQCNAVGGTVCFYMKYGTQGAPSPCEGIDLPSEGVSLQYSTNNGTTWTTIEYWDPNGGYDPLLTSWNKYCVTIPQAAMTANTRLRWYQDEASGAGFDAWGLDEMVITLSAPGFTYDWAHDAQGPQSTSSTPTVQPLANTTYVVTYTNGVQTCTDSVTVNVNLPVIDTYADKALVCEGATVNLTASSSLIPLDPTECAGAGVDCDPKSTTAIEIQFGNGTIESQTGNAGIGYLGASNFDGAVRAQFLLRATDLIAAGLKPGKFTNMQFDILSNEIGTKNFNNFEITFMCTNMTALPSTYVNTSGGVLVHSPKTVAISTGWHTMFFDQGFVWDGQTNILINTCWKSNQSSDVITRHRAVGYAATKTYGTNTAGTNNWNCADNSTPFTNNYNSLPNFKFGQCVARAGTLNYSWISNPTGFVSNIAQPTATVISNPTQYIVFVNEQGRPPGCAVTDTIIVNTYRPAVTVNPNPAAICPPGTTSANLVSTATTATSFPSAKKFTNNTALAVPESQNAPGTCTPLAGTTVNSVIAVSGATPATLAGNPIQEVAINMTCTRTGDYEFRLISPSGQTFMIFDQRGTGANFTNMRLRPVAATAVTAGVSPFNGIYSPEVGFDSYNGNVNGNWTLAIRDNCTGTLAASTGTLTSWSITFNTPNYIDTYLWSPAADLSSTNTPNTTASPASNTTYTLTVTDAAGCFSAVQVPVSVSSAPTIPVGDTTICVGGTANLTAIPFDAGTGNYTWNPSGQNTQTINVSPTTTTGYSVTYVSGGCTGTGNATVTVVGQPTLTIAPQTVCAGQSATLNAIPSQNGGTFAWSNGGTTQSISVSPATTQYYYVNYDIGGCAKYDSVLVTVNSAGTIVIPDTSICGGNSVTFNPTVTNSGGTYSWAPGGQTTATITVTPNNTRTYTVNYTANGCTTSDQGTVTVMSSSSVTVNNATVCNNGSATLNATGLPAGGTYSWIPGGQTTASITVTPAATSTYTVNYTVNNCTSSANSIVTVAGNESVTVNDETTCIGNPITLNSTVSTGGGTYLWTPGNFTTPNITVSPNATTTYTVTYSIGSCTFTDNATVTVNPAASVNLRDTSICNGATVTLNPTVSPAGGTYSWSGGQTTPTITVSPTTNTTNTVTYNVNGCTISDNGLVRVNPVPTATISGGGTICDNQIATVDIAFTGNAPWNFTYSDGTNNNTINGVTSSPYSFNTNIGGTYTVVSVSSGSCAGTVSGSAVINVSTAITTSNVNGVCDASNNYTVSFEITGGTPASYAVSGMSGGTITATSPYIFTSNTINGGTPNYSFTISDGGPCASTTVSGTQNCNGCLASAVMSGGGAICPGEAANITMNMQGTGPWTVTYSNGTSNVTLNNITSPYSFSTTIPGNYSLVSVTDATACTGSVSGSATVTQKSNPSVTVNNPSICLGDIANLVANPGQAGGTFNWSNGTNGQSISITPGTSGTSSLTVTYNLNGCTSSATSTITINAVPTVNSNDTTICAGSNAFLYTTVSPAGGTFSWNPTGSTNSNVNVSPTNSTDYKVTYTLSGCNDDDISTVTVKPSPSLSVNDASLCIGQSATLTGSVGTTGGTFLWSPSGQTTQTITVTPSPGTYEHEVAYSLNGCTSKDTSTVVVANSPTLTVADASICEGEVATLTATTNLTGGIYTWGPGAFADTSSINVIPASTTTYNLNYDLNGCTANTTAQVTVSPSPAITVSDATICAGETATLTSTTSNAGGTYTWSPGSHPNTASINVSPSATTRYYLNYSLNGCTVIDSGDVTVNNSASVSLSDTNVCAGSSATLTAVPSMSGGSFIWAPGGQSTSSITVAPNNNTTYTVSYAINGCSSSNSSNVVVNPIPTVSVTDSVTICVGNSTTLIATPSIPNGTYLWLAPQANNETTSTLTVSPTTFANYTVQYTRNGCVTQGSGRVYVNPAATISVTDDQICEGDLASLTASTSGNSANITWSPGGFTGPTINVSPGATTDYVAQIVDNSCINRDTGTVVVIPTPSVTPFNSGPYCEGETILLTVSNTPNATYQWVGPNSFSSNQQNPTKGNAVVADSGDYVVLVSVGQCSDQGGTTVVINAPTETTISPAGPFCEDVTTSLLTVNNPGGVFSGSGISNGQSGEFNPSLATVGNNTITYTPAAGACQTAATRVILVNGLPQVDFLVNNPQGCVPFLTSFTDQTTPVGSALVWNFGDGTTSNTPGTVQHSFAGVGSYDVSLQATSPAGCVNSISKPNAITVIENAIADFSMTPENISENVPYVEFLNSSLNANSYMWIFGSNGTSSDVNPNLTFIDLQNDQIITLIATNEGGCADTVSYTLKVTEELLFYIPNAFTPDGDKFNQYFQPVFTAGFDANTYNLQIFNRWGDMIFQSTDAEIGWDGTFDNRLVPIGSYIWKVQFKSDSSDKKYSQQGVVNVLR
jgi:gliding motility-associated-like protein